MELAPSRWSTSASGGFTGSASSKQQAAGRHEAKSLGRRPPTASRRANKLVGCPRCHPCPSQKSRREVIGGGFANQNVSRRGCMWGLRPAKWLDRRLHPDLPARLLTRQTVSLPPSSEPFPLPDASAPPLPKLRSLRGGCRAMVARACKPDERRRAPDLPDARLVG